MRTIAASVSASTADSERTQTSHDLETINDLQKLTDLFDRRGYSAVDIEGIMSRNFVDFFRKAWN